MTLLATATPIYGQLQENNDTANTVAPFLKDVMEAEELQRQQERILNLTKLWEEADLIDFDRDGYDPLYMPAEITYQSNNTIVL